MSVTDYTSTKSKKRARIKGTAIDYKPEMKVWNAIFKADMYPSSVLMHNVATDWSQANRSNGWGSWFPMELEMPNFGTTQGQALGRKINIKWLRFKD